MQQFILPVLAKHKKLTIAPFGTFSLTEEVLSWKAVEQILAHQGFELMFENNTEKTSDALIDFTSQALQIDTASAVKKTNDYYRSLASQDSFVIDGLGMMKKISSDHFSLEPSIAFQQYLQPVVADKIIRKNVAHTIRVGEYDKTNIEMEAFYAQTPKVFRWSWWHTALTITLLTIGYLIFYFYNAQG
jgi:hypothetical protein